MTNNTLEQIKQAESEAKQTIEDAKQNSAKIEKEASTKGANSYNDVENQIAPQINGVIEEARKDIQNLKTKKERQLEIALSKLNSIDASTVNVAAKIVIKQITK